MYTRFIASIDKWCIYTDRQFYIVDINGENLTDDSIVDNEEGEEESGQITSASFSNDGKLLAIAYHNKIVIYTYNNNNNNNNWHKKKNTITTDDDDSIMSIAFSPTNTKIITGSYEGKIQIWNVSSGKRIGTLVGHSKCITSIAFNPIKHDQLVTGSWDQTVRIWNLNKNIEEKY